MSQKIVILKFTRDVLGCTCPDDVFDKIQCQWLSILSEKNKVFEIRIGGRLLVFLWNIDKSSVQKYLARLVQFGKETPDKDGFNRFRLVVTSDTVKNLEQDIERQFQNVPQIDEKIHLHAIPNHQIPKSLFTVPN